MTNSKQIIFSGIQPTGVFTLGNYLGAIQNWAKLQAEYDCIYSVVDLHAVTVRQDAAELRKNVLNSTALLLAAGIDPKESVVFAQSANPHHAELAWVLNCFTPYGSLSRMTQFKDKSAKHSDNINAGLFTYPCLMAADILAYNAHLVPIGADQKQHLELSRDIAIRFNGVYGDVFTVPEPYIGKTGARVMSLTDPSKKMSKSDENQNAFVSILDEPAVIVNKFKRAVTDSGSEVRVGEEKDGINNLIGIYSAVTGMSVAEVEREFDGKGYGDFKKAVGEAVAEKLRPIREEHGRLVKDKAYLQFVLEDGAEKARRISGRVLNKVYRKVGFR